MVWDEDLDPELDLTDVPLDRVGVDDRPRLMDGVQLRSRDRVTGSFRTPCPLARDAWLPLSSSAPVKAEGRSLRARVR